jgi:hypothetical protein
VNPLIDAIARLSGVAQPAKLPPLPTPPPKPMGRPYVPPAFIEPGNVDLFAQPSVPNPRGGMSTVNSFSVNFDGREYLLPTVTPDGRLLSEEEAIREFQRTGRHLGMFATPKDATDYAAQLHEEYEGGKYNRRAR